VELEHLPIIPQLTSKNNLACKVMPDSVAEIFNIGFFVQSCVSAHLFLHRPTVLTSVEEIGMCSHGFRVGDYVTFLCVMSCVS